MKKKRWETDNFSVSTRHRISQSFSQPSRQLTCDVMAVTMTRPTVLLSDWMSKLALHPWQEKGKQYSFCLYFGLWLSATCLNSSLIYSLHLNWIYSPLLLQVLKHSSFLQGKYVLLNPCHPRTSTLSLAITLSSLPDFPLILSPDISPDLHPAFSLALLFKLCYLTVASPQSHLTSHLGMGPGTTTPGSLPAFLIHPTPLPIAITSIPLTSSLRAPTLAWALPCPCLSSSLPSPSTLPPSAPAFCSVFKGRAS